MKRYLTVLIWTIFITSIFSQEPESQTKGLQPFSKSTRSNSGVSYAVVVGISDYQDEGIPDLKYADRDAKAFAEYLQSEAGGSLDKDHIKLLLNSEATQAQFDAALYNLVDNVKEDDNVIIYFSGHGDVERKTMSLPGFLLCWDAMAHGYTGGGAYSLFFLKGIIETISNQNKANVLLVTDACRSGNLAGSAVGAEATALSLSQSYAKEVKILSCRPEEYSVESDQWGGGRGVFSYHLLDGLYGLADANNDEKVSLKEIERYLEDIVPLEADPNVQNPMTVGKPTAIIANIHQATLNSLREGKKLETQIFASTEQRGIEDDILAAVGSKKAKIYSLFNKAIKEKRFLDPKNDCADYYYNQLKSEAQFAPLHGSMRRNYAAALQDDAQQMMNKWMKTDLSQFVSAGASDNSRLPTNNFDEKVKVFPEYLEKAAELLGNKHYMYPILKARKYFFEGYLIANSNYNRNHEIGKKAISKFKNALNLQKELPQAHWQMSRVYGNNLEKVDSLIHYANLVIDLYPTWILPYTDVAFLLSIKFKEFDKAKYYLEKASKINPNSISVINAWGIYYYNLKEYGLAESQYKKAIQINPSNAAAYVNLGNICIKTDRYSLAEQYYKTAITLDPSSGSYNNLGIAYYHMERYEDAKKQYQKSIQLDNIYLDAYFNLGIIDEVLNDNQSAIANYKKSTQLDPLFIQPYINLGLIYLREKDYTNAEVNFLKAIELDDKNPSTYNNLGIVYEDLNDNKKAETYYLKSIKIDSKIGAPHSNLGNIYRKQNKYKKAEKELKTAIELDVNDAKAHNNLGIIYKNSEKYELAEKHLKKVLEIDSKNADAYNNLGLVYQSNSKFDDAELHFLKALKYNPNNIAANNNLGNLYKNQKRTQEAEKYFQNVIDIEPSEWVAALNLAILFQSQNKWTESASLLIKIVDKTNATGDIYALLGNAYTHIANKMGDAEENLNIAIKLKPDWPDTYIYYAQYLLRKNDTDKAWGALEQGLILGLGKGDLSPNDLQLIKDFEIMRKKDKWMTLMKKYFPELFKQ